MARPSAIEGRLLMILADAVRTPRRSTRWLVGIAVAAFTTAILGAQSGAADATSPQSASPPSTQPTPIVTPEAVM